VGRHGATILRTMRIPDPIWIAAVRKAQEEGTTVTAVVVVALRRYLKR